MATDRFKGVKFQGGSEAAKFIIPQKGYMSKFTDKFMARSMCELHWKLGEKDSTRKTRQKSAEKDLTRRTFREKELLRVFSKDYEIMEKLIFVRFHTAYVAPSSHVFGRGELIIDPQKIASRFLHKSFWFDILVALPLPQLLVWAIIPHLRGTSMINTKNVIRLIIMFQYLLRLYLIFPLTYQIIKATGVVLETAWAGAAYNLMLYMLASHEHVGTSYRLNDKKSVGENSVDLNAWIAILGFLIVT
ncbi:hypothetical protein QYF36_003911 [Acer negundo]|nr:hypothetical protein QYF36_003911 [Acer negundo]